jgi:hypothetical protein
MWLFFPPFFSPSFILLDFLTRGVQKCDLKKSQKFFRSRQNKYLLTSLFLSFFTPPLAGTLPSAVNRQVPSAKSFFCTFHT